MKSQAASGGGDKAPEKHAYGPGNQSLNAVSEFDFSNRDLSHARTNSSRNETGYQK
jgi:hypothetical protein